MRNRPTRWREPDMGGRYGASDDGSSDYQDRRPDEDDRSDEQQTIAEAVQAVADQQQADDSPNTSRRTDDDDSSNGDSNVSSSGQHPFTNIRARSGRSSGSTLKDIDNAIAEYVADQLTETVEWSVEEADPTDTDETDS